MESIIEAKFINRVHDPSGIIEKFNDSFASLKKGCFLLCNAGTRVSEHEGISAAGVNPAARRLTPALDAEALITGKTISSAHLPVSPKGIVSPVVITRACLGLMKMESKVVDCGSFHPPAIETIRLCDRIADCPSTGKALPRSLVFELFEHGLKLGRNLAQRNDYLVLAECVPGGTTTAMAVLSALGYEVQGLMSSSLPTCNHSLRWELVQKGFANAAFSKDDIKRQPLLSVAWVGDPMQAVVAGIASAASNKIPIVLAGGSQMLAVWALIKRLSSSALQNEVLVMTTGWVAYDRSAGVGKLAQMVGAPLAASCPDFHKSRHKGLQAYEEGNVKEGVGAGASMCLAHMSGFGQSSIMNAIDDCYDDFVLRSD